MTTTGNETEASASEKATRSAAPTLRDKVVVVTGAAAGIGAETARVLAGGAAKVVLADRHAEGLRILAEEIAGAGGAVTFREADVTRREDMAALIQHATDTYGGVDVLVSNAGVGPISPIDDLRVEEWEQMIDVNIKGLLSGIAAALPLFRQQGSGLFVNLASTAAYVTTPNQAVYSGTKHAARRDLGGAAQGGRTPPQSHHHLPRLRADRFRGHRLQSGPSSPTHHVPGHLCAPTAGNSPSHRLRHRANPRHTRTRGCRGLCSQQEFRPDPLSVAGGKGSFPVARSIGPLCVLHWRAPRVPITSMPLSSRWARATRSVNLPIHREMGATAQALSSDVPTAGWPR